MANAIFTTSASSIYVDQPEVRYHFPRRYLNTVNAAVGDWVIYYEPRRTEGPSSRSGRQAYFAMARVKSIESDQLRPSHFYAYLSEYLEFDVPVPFERGRRYLESALMKSDGSTNKGRFGWAVRELPRVEFEAILAEGFSRSLAPWELADRVAEPLPEPVQRPTVTQVVSRKFRDEAFRRHVREAYGNACAVTGLKLINGGGRPEVQAAHIRPVECDGPDTVRNGLALTATVHWMFDRGLITVDDSFRIMVSPAGLPEGLAGWIAPGKAMRVPKARDLQPHPAYLKWHREHRFKR
jgi:putative restriction endonuclease